uniref:Fatty-acid desaturase n=1 Tax=Anabaena sp. XPORK15F TaxID=462641 RepID=A0A0U3AIW7_9NOST|nr:fatty-acid desaturase [Anabaena sp. XPORK15F]
MTEANSKPQYSSIAILYIAVFFVLPILGTLTAVGLLFYSGITWLEVSLLLTMYVLCFIGAEVGMHRFFNHHSFEAKYPMQVILAILGLMSASGGLEYWVIGHSRHHKYSDETGDIHSPHTSRDGLVFSNQLQGLYYSQLTWHFDPANGRNTDDLNRLDKLLKDPVMFKINELHLFWVILGFVIPAIIEGLITWSWIGAFHGLIWGGLVRVFLVQQFIASVNSVCHLYGDRPFKTNGLSTNNIWLAIPTLGGSWHNNHHAFPNSAITGLEWWQIDISSWVIWLLEKTGVVSDVKRPKPSMIEAKRLTT